jgi:hypothetical protein
MKRLVVALTAFALCATTIYALASQNTLSSPTTGTVSGLNITDNYNGAIDSLNTGNSGPTAPTNQLSGIPSLGNVWINTSTNPYPHQVYDGSSWRTPFWIDIVNHYTDVKISGGQATVTSAATVDFCNGVPQADVTITGTTAITSFGSTCKSGHIKVVTFAGILTLTWNAPNLINPGAANVTTATGDRRSSNPRAGATGRCLPIRRLPVRR